MMPRRHRVHVYVPKSGEKSLRGPSPVSYEIYLENLPCNISRGFNAGVKPDQTVGNLARRNTPQTNILDAQEALFYDDTYPPLPPGARLVWSPDNSYGAERVEYAISQGSQNVYGRSSMLRHRVYNIVLVDAETPIDDKKLTKGSRRYRCHG